ncbi:c2 domain-containing protein [Phthorimaea operculella]|nr:c2 domain-containing protein [Phthorimaea operculella]
MEERTQNTIEVDGVDVETRRARRRTFPRGLSLTRWRPSSLANLVSRRAASALHSYPSIENVANIVSNTVTSVTNTVTNTESSALTPVSANDDKALQVRTELPIATKESSKRGWSTIVTIIVVEARGIPDPPGDRATHNVYCKIRLGSETCKTKTVHSSHNPEWRERFKLHLNTDHLLRVSVWDKGKQKNFMGSCEIDLSNLQKERTHEMWQDLDDGFGAIRLNITMCAVRNVGDLPTSEKSLDEAREKYALLNLHNLESIGQLHVKVIGARGLHGKPYAYCTLELGNEKVQTHSAKAGSEPVWNKTYVFNVNDVSNTLNVQVLDSSLVSTLTIMDSLGRVSIPLLRIQNGQQRWYALKDRSKRGSAKGNCPRILLEMHLIYNPVKAALKLFQVPEANHVKRKTYKFDLAMVYSNLIFVRKVFDCLVAIDGQIRQFLEWDNRELSAIVLVGWLILWYNLRPWMLPMLLLIPFIFFWFNKRSQYESPISRNNNDNVDNAHSSPEKANTSLTSKIQGLPELTFSITEGIEYLETIYQKIINLVTFQVPFYSYFMMTLLLLAAAGLYLISFNYLMMMLGIYKYTRKHLNPTRVLNDDLIEFISRVPDNEILKDWEELSVPEPNHHRTAGGVVLVRADSSLNTRSNAISFSS